LWTCQAAIAHCNIMVSPTYLRGLDVVELNEADLPKLMSKNKIIQKGVDVRLNSLHLYPRASHPNLLKR